MAQSSVKRDLAKYKLARSKYNNGEDSGMTDAEYDVLEASLVKQGILHRSKQGTGSPVNSAPDSGKKQQRPQSKKVEVTLPIYMPSLAKYKPELGVPKFQRLIATALKYSTNKRAVPNLMVIMDKLDGGSLFVSWDSAGKPCRLITRGDGITGQDCSFLLPHLKIPAIPSKYAPAEARCEAVISRRTWESLKKLPEYAEYKSARALASGLLNRQSEFKALAKLDIVVLRLFSSAKLNCELSKGLKVADNCGLKTVAHTLYPIVPGENAIKYLVATLEKRAKASEYELDGLVIHALTDEQNTLRDVERKPKFAFAFKDDSIGDAPETTITDIVWKVSSFGTIVPKAMVAPVKFGGTTVRRAALHNAQWAMERGAGIGATVKLIRSGNIIPKIVAVVKKATLVPPKHMNWEWDASGTNIILKKSGATADKAKRSAGTGKEVAQTKAMFERTFHGLDLDGMGPSCATLCTDLELSIAQVLNLDSAEKWAALLGVEGSGSTKTLQRWAKSIKGLRTTATDQNAMGTMMAKCGVFGKGLGERRLRALFALGGPGVFKTLLTNNPTKQQLVVLRDTAVKAMGPSATEVLRKGIVEWMSFVKELGIKYKYSTEAADVAANAAPVGGGPLSGKVFSWTGYRDAAEEKQIKDLGGRVDKFGSKTNILFYKIDGKASGKVEKAGSKAWVFGTWFKKFGGK